MLWNKFQYYVISNIEKQNLFLENKVVLLFRSRRFHQTFHQTKYQITITNKTIFERSKTQKLLTSNFGTFRLKKKNSGS